MYPILLTLNRAFPVQPTANVADRAFPVQPSYTADSRQVFPMGPSTNLLARSPTLEVNPKPTKLNQSICIAHVLAYNNLRHVNVLSGPNG